MKNDRVITWISFLMLPIIIFMSILISQCNKRGENQPNYIEEYKPITPRDMNGLDTIRAGDSLYIIKFNILKVIPDSMQNESQDKYENGEYDYNE